MLYVDPALVSAALGGRSPPFVPDAVADDPALAELVRDAFADFPQPLEPLALDALVSRMAELLAARSDDEPSKREPAARRAVMLARDFLAAEALRTVRSEELEKVSGLARFALARHFRAAFGTSPWEIAMAQRV